LTAPGEVHARDHRFGNYDGSASATQSTHSCLPIRGERPNSIGRSAHYRPARSDTADQRQHRYSDVLPAPLLPRDRRGDIEDTRRSKPSINSASRKDASPLCPCDRFKTTEQAPLSTLRPPEVD